ncbi:MAG: hypothetical protein VXY24_01335, partial [Pseudomonadota bacterium]|nr:hypothetical protein [Pseudomonadota bacterium]
MEVSQRHSHIKITIMASISPLAVVDPNAQIAETADIGPFCTIGPNVTIGGGTKLMSHVVVDGHTKLGEDCMV